ncbi:hypothetical protein ASZ90_006018 [hydrocarbon metagenome]|uniref:Uncharacterized protein n=1 Tax=hydrocarbon metagenome TaxID=938273 RepID=A0A0W8FTU1_9ZZZZ
MSFPGSQTGECRLTGESSILSSAGGGLRGWKYFYFVVAIL